MSAPKDPAVTPEPEVQPETREVPNEELLKAVHDLSEVAKSINGDADKRLEAARIMKEVEEQRKKNRVISPPAQSPTVKNSLKEVLEAAEPANDYEREVRQTWCDLKLVHEILSRSAKDTYRGPLSLKIGRRFDNLVKKADNWDTATDTAGGGTVGSQDWVQVMYASEAMDYFHLQPVIASSMQVVNIPGGTGSFRVPLATSENTVDVISEVTSATTTMMQATTGPNTDYITLTPAKHRGGVLMSVEFTEDAALDAVGYARRTLVEQMGLALDDAILNGQATADDANHDGTNASEPADGCYNGLRYFAHYSPGSNETSNSGAVIDTSTVVSMRASMGKFGVRPTDCRLIVSPAGYLTLVADSTNKFVVTVDQYGPSATIATGELAKVYGIPVLVSDRMPENMNSTGDLATTGSTTGAIMFNRTRWLLGMKRQVIFKLVEHAAADQLGLYAFMRTALAGDASSGNDNHTWYVYNCGLA